jgi:hypothetical protein
MVASILAGLPTVEASGETSKVVASAESESLNEQEVKDAVAGSQQGSTRGEKRARRRAKDDAAKAAMAEYPVAVEVAQVEAGVEGARTRRRQATLEAAEAVVMKPVAAAVAMARAEVDAKRRKKKSSEAWVKALRQEAVAAAGTRRRR